jgi:hypothetical protein
MESLCCLLVSAQRKNRFTDKAIPCGKTSTPLSLRKDGHRLTQMREGLLICPNLDQHHGQNTLCLGLV